MFPFGFVFIVFWCVRTYFENDYYKHYRHTRHCVTLKIFDKIHISFSIQFDSVQLNCIQLNSIHSIVFCALFRSFSIVSGFPKDFLMCIDLFFLIYCCHFMFPFSSSGWWLYVSVSNLFYCISLLRVKGIRNW